MHRHRKYDAQLDVFGRLSPIIPGDRGTQEELFATIDLPDVSYAGTVEQPTLDGTAGTTDRQIFVTRR